MVVEVAPSVFLMSRLSTSILFSYCELSDFLDEFSHIAVPALSLPVVVRDETCPLD